MAASPVSIAELSQASTWPEGGTSVSIVQTHASVIALTGDRAYKVKKPVDLGFLDFTRPERRHALCLEEVRLNRRLARRTYRGVVPLYRTAAGALRAGPEGGGPDDVSGRVVEWAVAMERLPADRMLDRLLDAGAVDNSLLGELAGILAEFHARAVTGPGVDEHGSPEAVARNTRENVAALAREVTDDPARRGVLLPGLHAFLAERLERELAALGPTLARRVAEGRVRDGHGDLHAGNVCVLPEGIEIYDCIEFADRFRCGDVASDLAFLTMDLRLRGFHAFAGYLARQYALAAADPGLPPLLRFYEGYRALVRAKVDAIRAREEGVEAPEREEHRLRAMRHVHLAAGLALPPAVILTCGLPASGKSALAARLAVPLDAEVHASDVRRKLLAGLSPGHHVHPGPDAGLYAPESRARTYRSLLDDVGRALGEEGRSVVIDAAFTRREERRPFLDAATRLGRPVLVVQVEATDAVAEARLRARAAIPDSPSDADLEVLRTMRARFEPPDEVPSDWVVVVPTDAAPVEAGVARVLARLALRAGEVPGDG